MELLNDVRWQCAGCSRFIAESAVGSEDYLDPGAYYGVSTRRWADCPRCGRTDDPRVVVIGQVRYPDSRGVFVKEKT
jgi:hypothetical protein